MKSKSGALAYDLCSCIYTDFINDTPLLGSAELFCTSYLITAPSLPSPFLVAEKFLILSETLWNGNLGICF